MHWSLSVYWIMRKYLFWWDSWRWFLSGGWLTLLIFYVYVFVCFVSLEREIIRLFWYFMTFGLPYHAITTFKYWKLESTTEFHTTKVNEMKNFNFSFRFLEKLLTFGTFWGILGPQRTLWRHRWIQISKHLRFWLHHPIPHDESSVNGKFQLLTPFPWEVINIWPFLGYFGCPGDTVTSQVDPNFETFAILTPPSNSPRRK
jgi:hypothetical protein